MKKGLCCAAMLGAASLMAQAAGTDAAGSGGRAESAWFTIAGDARMPQGETVQVDPVALKTEGDFKVMKVRVSRSQERHNWDEVPYRSYESRVLINCRTRRAHYLEASFYSEPLWVGNPHHVGNYLQDPKPMLFKGMNPNPTERIIRAACRPAQ